MMGNTKVFLVKLNLNLIVGKLGLFWGRQHFAK